MNGLTTRREFLERSAAAAALLSLPAWAAAACRGSGDKIVRAAIHPAIGIGRVGNSRESFFFGPETPGALPRAPGGFKDAHGAVARQAARFRVYGLDASGRPVRELTAQEAEITWRVNVANTAAPARLPRRTARRTRRRTSVRAGSPLRRTDTGRSAETRTRRRTCAPTGSRHHSSGKRTFAELNPRESALQAPRAGTGHPVARAGRIRPSGPGA